MFYSLWNSENDHYVEGNKNFIKKEWAIRQGIRYLMYDVFVHQEFRDNLNKILSRTDEELEEMLRENNFEVEEHEGTV
jgi:hypothetical protein